MAKKYECSYCLYYARPTSFSDQIDESHRFIGTREEVVEHAFKHPIGDPEDFAIPYETTQNSE